MRSSTLSSATAALLTARAYAGQAIVQNNCGGSLQPWVWSVGAQAGPGHQLTSAASQYSETFRSRSDNAGGISIKVGNSNDLSGAVAQFEYTLSNWGGNNVFYDLSNINGNPFKGIHYQLKASDPKCPVVDCPASSEPCKAVYNVWNDDTATHMCSANSDLILTLCADGKSASSDSSSSSSGSPSGQQQAQPQAAPAPSPSPSPSPSPTPQAAPAQPSSQSGFAEALANLQKEQESSSSSNAKAPSSGSSNAPAAAEKVAANSGSSNSNSAPAASSSSTGSTTMVVVNADGSVHEVDTLPPGAVPVNKVKRDEHSSHSHAHSHLHERLRRSRIFRAASSHL